MPWEKKGLEGRDPQKDAEIWKGLWQNWGVWDEICHSTSSFLLSAQERTQSCASPSVWPPQWPAAQSNHSGCDLPPQNERCGWGDGCSLEGWSAFQDPPPAGTPRNAGASISARLHTAQPALVLAAPDLAQGWVDSWGLPKAPKVLCFCCNSCILLSLLCLAGHSDPTEPAFCWHQLSHWLLACL